jgi:hypothetical protein
MAFRTKGSVQIELKTPAGAGATLELTVLIAPSQSHTVTVEKKDFIVFMETPVPNPLLCVPALVWTSDTRFPAGLTFEPALIAAAAGALCVELEVEEQGTNPPKIVGVILPASGK